MPSQLDLTLGAVEAGTLFSCMLYGAVTVQLYTYSRRCKTDPVWLIGLVLVVWALETFFTILSICYLYDGTISNYGNPGFIPATPWPLCVSVAIQGTVGAIVQSFFAYRVWKVSNLFIWPSLAWVGAVARVILTACIAYWTSSSGNIVAFSNEFGWAVLLSIAISLAVDILNVIALTWYLSSRRSGFHETSRMIDRIIIYSIETGLITSITALSMFITRLAMPDNYVWIGLLEVYARLYSNSLLLSLNARVGNQTKHHKEVNFTSSMTNSVTVANPRLTDRGISVQTVSFTVMDNRAPKPVRVPYLLILAGSYIVAKIENNGLIEDQILIYTGGR